MRAVLQCRNWAGALTTGVRAVLERSGQAGALTMDSQAWAQFCNAAVGRVCLPWSGRRALSVRTKQSGGCAYHGQACAQCCNEAPTVVRRAITKQSSGCGYHGQACARSARAKRRCYAGKKCAPLSAVSGPLA